MMGEMGVRGRAELSSDAVGEGVEERRAMAISNGWHEARGGGRSATWCRQVGKTRGNFDLMR
jgi:hypothetical protein